MCKVSIQLDGRVQTYCTSCADWLPSPITSTRRGTDMKNLADLCGLAVFDNNSTHLRSFFTWYQIGKRNSKSIVLVTLSMIVSYDPPIKGDTSPSFTFWRVFTCDVFVSMTGYQCPYLHIPYRSHLSWIGSLILSHTFTFVLLADLQILILLHWNQITLRSRKSKHWKL